MSPPRYERVFDHDDEENGDNVETSPVQNHDRHNNDLCPTVPNSPPPSFRSRTSSISHRDDGERQHLVSDAQRTLADTFDSPSDDESEDGRRDGLDERQRVMSGRHEAATATAAGAAGGEQQQQPQQQNTDMPSSPNARPPAVERRVTQMPVFSGQPTNGRVYGGNASVHDGVFANLSAKPERGEDVDEKPPPYEQAAADAAPPYWETTILAPGANSDEVFIDGLPVGSLFSFMWNGMISMSFQLVGFLLTYLLHTTHAAKNGSKAGLGITLIQYGFSMKGSFTSPSNPSAGGPGPDPGDPDSIPSIPDPNSHDLDPNNPNGPSAFIADVDAPHGVGAMKATDWIAYALMIMGWFILIRAISEYVKARRHEQLVLQSPSRGLNVAVVSEDERPEGAV